MTGKDKKFERGFTLVESLVAVSLFSIAVVTLLLSLGQGLSNTGYVKKKITAEYLAAEGIEYMRNLRDTYVLYSPGDWNSFVGKLSPCTPVNGCQFDAETIDFEDPNWPIKNMVITACGGPCSELKYDPNNGRYNYSSGTNSGFTRKIRMETVPGGSDEKKISSTVFWTQNSGNYSITFSENLYNWVE